jgi:hypothetical protein
LILALIWHPESACIFKIDFYRVHRGQKVKNTPRGHKIQQNMLFAARGRGALLIVPRPLLGCQIEAEIQGFLLMYRFFQYKHWFPPNFELKDFPEYTVTPCR